MYYLTITKNGHDIVSKKCFEDYSSAVAYVSNFYKPKTKRSVLPFRTEVINGKFARSYAFLTKSKDLNENEPYFQKRYHRAVEQETAFSFDGSYIFRIESDVGIQDVLAMQSAQDSD